MVLCFFLATIENEETHIYLTSKVGFGTALIQKANMVRSVSLADFKRKRLHKA